MKALLGSAVVAIAATTNASATILTNTFDTSVEDWTGTGGRVTHVASGGNPGGFLSLTDIQAGVMYISAPAAYFGDLSAFYGGTLSFDAKNLNNDITNYNGFGAVTFGDGSDTVSFILGGLGAPPADDAWHHYSVTLDSAHFGADLFAVLSSVSLLTVVLEFHDRVSEITGFDNFVLSTPAPVAASEISMLGLFGLGAGLLVGLRRFSPSSGGRSQAWMQAGSPGRK